MNLQSISRYISLILRHKPEVIGITIDEHLEEGNTWGDTTWGTVNGIGENRLGRILMKVRKKLQEESK